MTRVFVLPSEYGLAVNASDWIDHVLFTFLAQTPSSPQSLEDKSSAEESTE